MAHNQRFPVAFTNLQVALCDLPTIENIEFQSLEPSYARLVCIIVLLVESLITGIATVLWWLLEIPQQLQEHAPAIYGLALFIMTLLPLYRFKAARAIEYSIRDHDLVLKSGLFWQHEVIQPIRRIQHVELTRGPLEKRTGLANIRLFSAGTSGATFTIPGLRLITAARIRRFVLQAERR
ncbi:MAG: PH domain-containing protein [Gammaproteobacteria bacterium]|nr:PH domain-containing protein [Gammaproteobacteria bacterium]